MIFVIKINSAQPPRSRGKKTWAKRPAEKPADKRRAALVVYGD